MEANSYFAQVTNSGSDRFARKRSSRCQEPKAPANATLSGLQTAGPSDLLRGASRSESTLTRAWFGPWRVHRPFRGHLEQQRNDPLCPLFFDPGDAHRRRWSKIWWKPLVSTRQPDSPSFSSVPPRRPSISFPKLRVRLSTAASTSARWIHLGRIAYSRQIPPAKILTPDSVLLIRDGALLAQRLNLDTLRMEGEPVAGGHARGGTCGFQCRCRLGVCGGAPGLPGLAPKNAKSTRVDRSGRQVAMVGGLDVAQRMAFAGPGRLSPDGRTLALPRTVNGNTDIWLIDLERGVPRRFTSEAVRERTPIRSPDGRRLAFASEQTGVFDIFERAFDGSGREKSLLASPEAKVLEDWSGTVASFCTRCRIQSRPRPLGVASHGRPPFDELGAA